MGHGLQIEGISTGLSAGMLPPKINPTSTWYGFPWDTLGTLVIVVANRESMVLMELFD